MPEILVGRDYTHVNGKLYHVVCTGHITLEGGIDLPSVTFRGKHDGRHWTRTVENFQGQHHTGVPRFTLVPHKCVCCGTTENVHQDTQGWRCGSRDCMVY